MVYLDGEICGNAYRPALFAAALNDLPLALSVRVTVAPGTNAPLGSLIVPRSDVVAIWPKARFTKEKAHRSTNPQSDRFTAVPPKVLHVKTGCEMYGCSLRHMCRLGFQHVTCLLCPRPLLAKSGPRGGEFEPCFSAKVTSSGGCPDWVFLSSRIFIEDSTEN